MHFVCCINLDSNKQIQSATVAGSDGNRDLFWFGFGYQIIMILVLLCFSSGSGFSFGIGFQMILVLVIIIIQFYNKLYNMVTAVRKG